MEQTDLMKAGVGTKDLPRLLPAKVMIQGVAIQETNKKGEKMESPLLNVLCKHPDKEETIKFTEVKVEDDKKLKVIGLWCNTDEDGNFQKGSSVSKLLEFLGCNNLNDLTGKELDAVDKEEGSRYLCLKAY